MVRFKVIKASSLLLVVAAVLLAIVIGGIILSAVLSSDSEYRATQANFVQITTSQEGEAETKSVFASFDSEESTFKFDPEDGGLSIEILQNESESPENKPSILIYHTHTHEAYEQNPYDQYDAIEAWRTTDHDHSIVRVGAELANRLRNCGFRVVHDTTDHEQAELNTAYTRSLETLKRYDEKFDLYIDLHRDAYFEGMRETEVWENGARLSRIMLLIGNGNGFEEKPYFDENLAFAEALTARINRIKPDLCKDVLVKDGRYNQHIGIFSILVEVGHNKNSLSEALASLPYLTQGIEELMLTDPDPVLKQIQEAVRASVNSQ